MIEREVDDCVGIGGTGAEGLEVFEIAVMDFSAGGLEGLGACVGPGEAEDLVAADDGDLGRGRSL